MSYQNRVNTYTCKAGHRTITVDRADGTTPMMIQCTHDGCEADATSAFYRVDSGDPANVPTHEWYAPTDGEILEEAKLGMVAVGKNHKYWTLKRMVASIKEHTDHGGLLLRRIGTAAAPVAVAAPRPKTVSRNAACPCESGKKYKRCCGK